MENTALLIPGRKRRKMTDADFLRLFRSFYGEYLRLNEIGAEWFAKWYLDASIEIMFDRDFYRESQKYASVTGGKLIVKLDFDISKMLKSLEKSALRASKYFDRINLNPGTVRKSLYVPIPEEPKDYVVYPGSRRQFRIDSLTPQTALSFHGLEKLKSSDAVFVGATVIVSPLSAEIRAAIDSVVQTLSERTRKVIDREFFQSSKILPLVNIRQSPFEIYDEETPRSITPKIFNNLLRRYERIRDPPKLQNKYDETLTAAKLRRARNRRSKRNKKRK